MDRECLKVLAHIDQTRTTVRAAIERLDGDDLIELFRDCAAGRMEGLDDAARQLVGLLAATAIYDLCQDREVEVDEAPAAGERPWPTAACPNCREDDVDRLIWLDDERVECQRCRTVYRPGAPAPDDDQTNASST